ncbi:MAG TPA: elongation factor G [Caldilineaceae bacterium]|mgnify:CR=1 FL=1|nr:elongation factor G [Caldilineaceae bacterium]
MAKYRTDQIRNVAILGHGSSGKTSLTEALLFKTGAINRMGRVEDGSTVSDWDHEEQRRQISINLSVVPIEVDNLKVNLIDVPGYQDFVGEVRSALHVAEAALVVVDAVAGVEVGTELAWGYLDEYKKPRIVFVNKMDRENANFQHVVDNLSAAFPNSTFIPMQLPLGAAESLEGVVSLISMKAYIGKEEKEVPIPDNMLDEVEAVRIATIEAAAEADDELILKYLEGEELTTEEVRAGLRKGVLDGSIVPIYCGTATTAIGLDRLLQALGRYVPVPSAHPMPAKRGDEEVSLASDPDGEPAAVVFKTIIDRFVGRMNYVRVFSGSLHKDEQLTNTRTGEHLKLGNLMSVRGKDLSPISELVAGDIGVLTKLEHVITGDTLAKEPSLVVPEPAYPQPLYAVAVSPATQADSAKLGSSLHALTDEDRTIRIENVMATKQTLLQGMGDTHVDVAIRHLESKYGVKVETAPPKVPYQETISRTASAQYRHKKQTGGAGQFAEVHMRVEPLPDAGSFEYTSEVFGGAISNVFLPSIEKGIRQVMEQGVVAGFPVVGIKAIVFDGKEHPVDSKDIAFQTAGREVFKLAVQQAAPVLLEPIYLVEVTVPEEYMGDIMGDFNTRRGRVQGMEQKGNRSVIKALVPFAEILNYSTELRSMTQGRGFYSIFFDHYDPVPAHLAESVIAQFKREEADAQHA